MEQFLGTLMISYIDTSRYPSEEVYYLEFQVPDGWNDVSELVKQGDIPTSRTGHCFIQVFDGSILI